VGIEVRHGERKLALSGRKAWALAALIDAGDRGVTPVDVSGPRWSDYVFKLRRDGLAIESIEERHGGAFAGKHCRYVLRSPVTVVERRRQHGERMAA
jgi:hypothetical protein